MSLTVKTDDITKGRKDVDPHGRFRGEWVNSQVFVLEATLTISLKKIASQVKFAERKSALLQSNKL